MFSFCFIIKLPRSFFYGLVCFEFCVWLTLALISEYFYYSYSNKRFKIPSYGYLLKIIDFDRGIGQIKLPGMKEPKIFMSDQFAREEEAGGQYNYEPFHTDKFSLIKPNPSFDLTRLATSLFWDMFSEGPEHSEYQNQKVFNTAHSV